MNAGVKMRAVVTCIFLFCGFCNAQTVSDWIVVEGQAPVQNISTQEAIHQAVQIAHRNAIEQFCGIDVRSQTLVRNFQTGADIIESFSYGYVVQAETLSIGREDFRKSPADPFIDLITVKMRIKVAQPDDKPDPYFILNAKIDKNIFAEGEKTKLIVESTKDCFITIFNITEEGKVYQIYPLRDEDSRLIRAGEVWMYPQKLVAMCLPGSQKNTEILKIIGTREPLDFTAFSSEGINYEVVQGMTVWKRPELGLEQLVRTLIAVPLNERTETTLVFTVVKSP